jgi:hypothetical protein
MTNEEVALVVTYGVEAGESTNKPFKIGEYA